MGADVSAGLQERYPEAQIMGTIGTGIANGKSGDNYLFVLALYNDIKLRCGLIQNVSLCPIIYTKQIEKALTEVGASSKDTVVLEYTTGNEEVLVSTF